jgi:hypothetical protein
MKEINYAMAEFWWGDTDERKKLHWFAWWMMCGKKGLEGWDFMIFILSVLLC